MTKLYFRPFDVILNQSREKPGFLLKKQSEYNMQKKKKKAKAKKKKKKKKQNRNGKTAI